ncbi:hypothetical protein XMIN_3709 [Xanthomonas citri pv. mangiferaeindicae LMG 941]|nr:hypothetical protein XMIN_3709 [Xanthomonas citri pv. mangiferaeindicae LMG 941]
MRAQPALGSTCSASISVLSPRHTHHATTARRCSVALDLSPSTQAADRPFDRRPAVCLHVPAAATALLRHCCVCCRSFARRASQ